MLILAVIPEGPDLSVGHLDKIAHLCEYLLFAWLLVQALPPTRLVGGQAIRASPAACGEPTYRLWAWVYATSYGVLIELIQAMVPWRSAEWGDAVANAVGAALGVWVGDRIPRKVKTQK